ncbi:MAG TPA: EAL domain-containing protein [Pyrinomonadaceae bacterium]|nr:EAL domain-containing protein [Pyrinomonadaceae bacterium]
MSAITKTKAHVLIVDDEAEIRDVLHEFLSESYQCLAVNSAEAALELIATKKFDLIISDIGMERMSGLEMVPLILEVAPETTILMVSGRRTIESAIAAMHAGAFDYITKPFDLRHVDAAVSRAIEHRKLLEAKRHYEESLKELVNQRTVEFEHLATHDPLTDLPNRALFEDRVAQAVAVAQRTGQMCATLFLALDGFKKIVDTLGHGAGDLLLKDVARRLKKCMNESDTVARFDGYEFALLLTQVTETKDLVEISRSITEVLRRPFGLVDQEVYVTASIGISLFPYDGRDLRTLLKNADAALYRAEMQGGNNYQFYASEMNAGALKRLALESSLRQAVENEEFVVHYQSQVDLQSKSIVGKEALVRWQHPELGLLPPGDFIDLAEKTGLILDIGHAVMRSACLQARRWQLDSFPNLQLAVNVSARQLKQKDFLSRLVDILDESEIDPATLELELTETSIMEDPESAARLLAEIRRMGVKIAIDDFGTGYSSLSYLKCLPIDTLKLDRSFIYDVTIHPDHAALVMAIITLAHNLRLKVIAEGVETEEQLNFLRLLRCDEGQGYFFDKPTSAELTTPFASRCFDEVPGAIATAA